MTHFGVDTFFARIRSWVSRRGIWGVLAVVLGTAIVLTSGVGVTMAATGTLPGIVAQGAEPPVTPTAAVSPHATSTPVRVNSGGELPDGFDTYDGIDWALVRASGFTGLQISFTPGHVSYIAQAIKDGEGSLTVEVFLNGQWWANSKVPCVHTQVGQPCNLAMGDMLDAEHGYCAPGGDVLTIRAFGFGIDETKTVAVPAEFRNCPTIVAPEPDSQPEPTVAPTETPIPSQSPAP
jgi:hypothetical protein